MKRYEVICVKTGCRLCKPVVAKNRKEATQIAYRAVYWEQKEQSKPFRVRVL